MSDEKDADQKSSKEIDKASSAACTKSGAFALGLSLVLLFLVHDWEKRPSELALGEYVADRMLLNMNLDQLDQDPAWRAYKSDHEDAEQVALGKLPEVFTYSPTPSSVPPDNSPPSKEPESTKPHADQGELEERKPRTVASGLALALPAFWVIAKVSPQIPPTSSPKIPPSLPSGSPQPNARSKFKSRGSRPAPKSAAPPAPTGLKASIVGPIPEVSEIVVLTKKLNNSELLTNASSYSNYFLFSISKWVQKERMLVWQEMLHNHCSSKPIDLPAKKGAPSQPDPTVVADCLSIQDWRELAAFEVPSTGSPDQIGGQFRRDVDVSVGGLPRRVDEASFVVAALLIFTLLYFGAFLREATHSENFPARATLFGAFARTPTANILMLGAALVPCSFCLTVAVVSKNWILYTEAVLVGLATGWVFAGFHKKHYFNISFLALKASLTPHWLWNLKQKVSRAYQKSKLDPNR
jgi:hypothetical protein